MRLSGIKRLHIALLCLLAALLAAAAGTMAWYGRDMAQLPQMGGSVTYMGKYFQSGDGMGSPKYDPETMEDATGCAYEIATPEQFYNLAWLQYMGYFNQPDENGDIPTTYFYLSADLDMSGYVLPPIGTADYPFLGNFDGDGHTISGLTVTNKVGTDDTPIKDLPYSITMGDPNYEVSGVEIIGLFGVVGALPGDTYSYSSQTNEIKNLYIENLTVKTQTEKSLIGIAAGYVNGMVKNVGVIGDTTISIAAIAPLSDYTDNMSDFSLIGYCTAAYRVQNNTVTTDGSLDESTGGSGGTGGTGAEWGGSIGVNALYNRLATVYKETASETARIDTYVSKEVRTYNMFDNTVVLNNFEITSGTGLNRTIRYHDYGVNGAYAIGNISYSYYDVYGHRAASGGDDVVTLNAANAYWVFMTESGPYLNRKGTEVTAANTPTTMWALDTDGHLYTVEPGTDTKYYLSVDTTGASLTNTPTAANIWTVDGDTLKVNGTTQYLSYDGTKWCLQSTGTYAKANSMVEFTKSVRQGRTSYFPINAKEEDNFSVDKNNTGYFVGGSYSTNYGDFRVGSYGLSSYIWKAFGKSSSSQIIDLENDKLQVYTCTAKSVNESSEYEFSLINDPSTLGLEKYDAALAQLEDIFKSGSGNVYGLRFMQSEISKNYLMTAPVVKINGKTTYNYEMPESSIDFQLVDKGKISFFAATMVGSPNYFFSLHHIIRNPDSTIQEIKKIQRIYEEGNTYIYEYNDGTFSGTKSAQATLAFDLDWIMSPNHPEGSNVLHQNSVYYFEIPVNAGEYALGAHTRTDVKSSLGAYLLYLDIGANGDEGGGGGDTEPVVTTMSATAKQFSYPMGVDFLADNTTDLTNELTDIQNSAAIRLPGGTTGGTFFTRVDNTITVTSEGNAPEASYIKDGVTVVINGTAAAATPTVETVYLKKVTQTTGGVTTVSIYKGTEAPADETASNINELVLSFTYTAGGTAVSTSYALDMPGSTWELNITVSNVSIDVTEVGTSGFAVTINGGPVTGTGIIAPEQSTALVTFEESGTSTDPETLAELEASTETETPTEPETPAETGTTVESETPETESFTILEPPAEP